MSQWDIEFVKTHPREAVDQIYRLLKAVNGRDEVKLAERRAEEAVAHLKRECDLHDKDVAFITSERDEALKRLFQAEEQLRGRATVERAQSERDSARAALSADRRGYQAYIDAASEQRDFAIMAQIKAEKQRDSAREALRKVVEAKGHTDTQVFFYERDFYIFSNFSAFRLKWREHNFDTSEAAYQWAKFMPNDPGVAAMIRSAVSAHEAFKIAERYRSVRRADWDAIKVDVMRDILRAKAAQHEYVRRKLLTTGDRELIEDSWRDDFWGWGPNKDGKNMLGKLWMEIRSALKDAEK